MRGRRANGIGFKRFLILGSEGGSYYATELKLTIENANHVLACISEDGVRVVRETVAISDSGTRAQERSGDFRAGTVRGLRRRSRPARPRLMRCRRSAAPERTCSSLPNTSRPFAAGVADCGAELAAGTRRSKPRDLAYQVVKYRQRERLVAHRPAPAGAPERRATRRTARSISGSPSAIDAVWATADEQPTDNALAFIWAFEQAQKATDFKQIIQLIEDFDLPREALPTEWLNDARVWEALLDKMPLTAMIRNLGVMSKIGLLKPFSQAESTVVKRLGNARSAQAGARPPDCGALGAARLCAGQGSARQR